MDKKMLNKLRPIWFDLKLRYEEGEELNQEEQYELSKLNKIFLPERIPAPLKRRRSRKREQYIYSYLIELVRPDGTTEKFTNSLELVNATGVSPYKRLIDGKPFNRGKFKGCIVRKVPNPLFPKPLIDLGWEKIAKNKFEEYVEHGEIDVAMDKNKKVTYYRVTKNKALEIPHWQYRGR